MEHMGLFYKVVLYIADAASVEKDRLEEKQRAACK
jgi:hypothetical protein